MSPAYDIDFLLSCLEKVARGEESLHVVFGDDPNDRDLDEEIARLNGLDRPDADTRAQSILETSRAVLWALRAMPYADRVRRVREHRRGADSERKAKSP